MAEDLFAQGIALLKKIQRSALPPDSQALYDRGMAMLQGEDPLAEEPVEETEETPEEEATEPEDPGEDTVQPDDASSTVDAVMEEQLEEATAEALEEEVKPE